MNLIQAGILNNYCVDKPEILVIFVQANKSLSIYYKNKNNKIAHKFGKAPELYSYLEPELVWVNLFNFETNYKSLLKYFHPDTYKGKRNAYELTRTIEILTEVKKSSKDIKIREVYEILHTLDNRPPHKFVKDTIINCSFLGGLRSRNPIQKLRHWMEIYGRSQYSRYFSDSMDNLFTRVVF